MLHRLAAAGGLLGWGLLGWGLLACGGAGVSFSGKSQPRVVQATSVGAGDRAPAGLHRLGRLSAGCAGVGTAAGFDDVRLSDLSCSRALLLGALKERAANAGASFLVEPRCWARGKAADAALQCTAEAWGPRDVTSFVPGPVAPRPLNVDPRAPLAPGAPPLGATLEAWRVRVDFWPAPGRAGRAAVDPRDVAEVDFAQQGHADLGDLRARCEADCDVGSVRAALRAAAASVGATSLVGVRCIQGREAPSCVASVTVLASYDEPLAEAP